MVIPALEQLPERGWGVISVPLPVVFLLHEYGLAKFQITPVPGVYQARLTRKGRRLLQKHRKRADDA